jgi:hypothetical protein
MRTIAGRILLGIKNEPPIQRACNPRFKSNAFYPVKTLMLMRGRGWGTPIICKLSEHFGQARPLKGGGQNSRIAGKLLKRIPVILKHSLR